MKKLIDKNIPDNYGIPFKSEMKSRILRIAWILNYLQNGSVNQSIHQSYNDTSQLDYNISKNGWINVIMEPTSVNINSSYYYQSMKKERVLRGDLPIVTYSIKECNNV